MRLGILSDIHEAVEPLREALAVMEREQVERVVFLGDMVHRAKRLDEATALLASANPVGVWGNHDFGLCGEVSPAIEARYSATLFRFMRGLQPRLRIEDCHFTHIEPWLDPSNVEHLWGFVEPGSLPHRLSEVFAASDARWSFMGHHHRWLAATPQGVLPWNGAGPLRLEPNERYFFIVHAVFYGHCAIFDTDRLELTPIRVRSEDGIC